MKIISIMNQKGGVAKTTTTINLAVMAAKRGKTLIIDTDEQANLSRQFGVDNPTSTIRDVLLGESFSPSKIEKNLDIIPASADLIGIENKLINEISRETKLAKALKPYIDHYDYILIDCPSNTSVVTVNALSCSDYVILPIKAEIFSIDGINHMIDFIRMIRDNINEKLSILGILITQYDERLKISKEIIKEMEEQKLSIALFDTKIRKNTAIAAAQLQQQSIFDYDSSSNGAMDYASFSKEVFNKLK